MTWSVGSRWVRWDPHLHTPGTLFNDQYDDDWDGFFDAIESADPAASALGITDYSSLSGYEAFRARRGNRLPGVLMVFANIELRLSVNTKRGGAINAHLLISPEDPEHIARTKEALHALEFRYGRERYPCTDEGLRRLGRAHSHSPHLGDAAALRVGASQFKASEAQIRDLLSDGWANRNVLLAVAAGQDGLGGLSADSMWEAARAELGSFANLIFSGRPGDSDYWLGRKKQRPAEKRACLHGSDAHSVAKVLKPDDDRFCWIRGDASFEALRQVLAEPEHRVFIGLEPPAAAAKGEIIKSLRVDEAPWLTPAEFELNDGLVTIIGAKGSGKTALLDIVALAADTVESAPGTASFFRKASELLGDLSTTATWADRSKTSGSILAERLPWLHATERVQYLSQQFVERLTAPDDLSEPLIAEIERVVFSAIPSEDRLQTSSFAQLRTLLVRQGLSDRDRLLDELDAETAHWLDEDLQARELPALRERSTEAMRAFSVAEAELQRAQPSGDATKLAELASLTSALGDVKTAVAASERKAADLRDVKTRIERALAQAVRSWEGIRKDHPGLVTDRDWELLKPRVDQQASTLLATSITAAEAEAKFVRDSGVVRLGAGRTGGLSALEKRREAVTAELGMDAAATRRRTTLTETVATAKAAAAAAAQAAETASGAANRRSAIGIRRLNAYGAIFGTFVDEAEQLTNLYQPLSRTIGRQVGGTSLRLNVTRAVGVRAWADGGEALLDLRTGPFQGRGSLERAARDELEDAWRGGTAGEVRAAMEGFIQRHLLGDLDLAHGSSRADVEKWLFGAGHLQVRYDLEYEGVPIARLSPGARGVVLLTLYLALDAWDARPLLIDQPEENLDPESVFKTLVPFFKTAARRRQIIMVTHNANLVVNTDSDQVIVARARRTAPDQLPEISYHSGGLEDPDIREDICSLLEGGRDAFRKRSERYGLA